MTKPAMSKRRRRRRGAALDRAIHAAVVDLVREAGAGAVTMEAVAARAGTSKPVLYRRWPNRAELLRDTLVPMAMDAIPHADTGSYRGDMLAILQGWADFFAGPQGVIAPAVVGAMPHDPELAEAFRGGVIACTSGRTSPRAIPRAIVSAIACLRRVDVARELGQALLWHRFLITGDEITPELVEHIVDDILIPYVRAPAAP